jgi:nicotine oxidoreductase
MTTSNLFKECIICGTSKDVEMHHVRSIKSLRDKNSTKDFFTRQMAAINRKQLPLCKEHHIQLHNNTLSIEDLNLFKKHIKGKNNSEK